MARSRHDDGRARRPVRRAAQRAADALHRGRFLDEVELVGELRLEVAPEGRRALPRLARREGLELRRVVGPQLEVLGEDVADVQRLDAARPGVDELLDDGGEPWTVLVGYLMNAMLLFLFVRFYQSAYRRKKRE